MEALRFPCAGLGFFFTLMDLAVPGLSGVTGSHISKGGSRLGFRFVLAGVRHRLGGARNHTGPASDMELYSDSQGLLPMNKKNYVYVRVVLRHLKRCRAAPRSLLT